jgi:hypothetical protein
LTSGADAAWYDANESDLAVEDRVETRLLVSSLVFQAERSVRVVVILSDLVAEEMARALEALVESGGRMTARAKRLTPLVIK